MKLWRLTRAPFVGLDGSGPAEHGARWTSPGLRVTHFATEASLAILVVLRYLPRDLAGIDSDYLLGWIETDQSFERLPFDPDPLIKRERGDEWVRSQRSLFAAVQSAVVPETDIIIMNCAHPLAASVAPLVTRPFSFHDCLSLPPLPPSPPEAT